MSSSAKKPEDMKNFFDVRAATYDDHMAGLELNEFYTAVAEPIAESTEEVAILDLGIGTGLELTEIFKKVPNARITGIDLSDKMLAVLKSKYPEHSHQLKLIADSYLEFPFGEHRFDYVISVMSIHHFLHDTKVGLYTRIHNALKPGGLYIEGDYVVSPQREVELLERYHQLMRQLKQHGDANLYHIDIPFSAATQRQLLAQAGFKKVEVRWQKKEAAVLVAQA